MCSIFMPKAVQPKAKPLSTLFKVVVILGSLAAIGTAVYLLVKKYKENMCDCCDYCDDDYDDLFGDDEDCDCCCDDEKCDCCADENPADEKPADEKPADEEEKSE